ncbi:unnamed protein product [Schistosoma margrebowiei]|uniref:Uncharacterized protein n=1 Tax=Schistosoma margrebowiei TaxID=48269 RepID=A0A3P8B307_9TREM|nr:unnamed protein product [Schistosoma margrebowiei]
MNPGYVFHPSWDSSSECTCTTELMFTLGLEPNIIRFKYDRVIHLATES